MKMAGYYDENRKKVETEGGKRRKKKRGKEENVLGKRESAPVSANSRSRSLPYVI